MTITRSPVDTIQAKVASGPSAGDHDRPLIRRALGRTKDERGTALTELALVMPVLLLILLGMIDFGKAINYWIDETHLANEGARLAVVNSNPGAGLATPVRLQQYILGQVDSAELHGDVVGTQRTAHSATVAICFYSASTGSTITTPTVGDTVEVLVRYSYNWLRGFPFPGDPASTITGKSAMRLEAVPTAYSTADNTGTCPSSA
jgi:Flp pilus assembly protein TadG